jgi:hypothetical protein
MSFLGIDIETGGCMLSHPLIAIGTCLVLPDGHKEKRTFRLAFDERDFEKRCVDEFWSKHPDKLEKLRALPESNIAQFANYVDSLDAKYPDLVLVSDNPSFDVCFINYHYES